MIKIVLLNLGFLNIYYPEDTHQQVYHQKE